MSPSTPSAPLERRARDLAEAGDWAGLAGLLGDAPRAEVLATRGLAYGYGEALYHTGRVTELAAYAEEYERHARAASDPEGVMRALNLAGIAAFDLGRIEEARSKFDALMELAEARSDPGMLARAANNLGAIANLRGRRHEALAYYRLAIPLYQRLDHDRGVAQSYNNLALSYRDLGRLDEAADAYERSLAIAERLRYAPLVSICLTGRAELALRGGDPALARGLVERGLSVARELGDPISEGEALRVRGLARRAAGVKAEGRRDLEAAIDRAGASGHRLLAAEAERDLGRALEEDGERERARDHLVGALHAFEDLGARADADAARDALERLGG